MGGKNRPGRQGTRRRESADAGPDLFAEQLAGVVKAAFASGEAEVGSRNAEGVAPEPTNAAAQQLMEPQALDVAGSPVPRLRAARLRTQETHRHKLHDC